MEVCLSLSAIVTEHQDHLSNNQQGRGEEEWSGGGAELWSISANDTEHQDHLPNNQLEGVMKELDIFWWGRAVEVGPSLSAIDTEHLDHLSNSQQGRG